MTGAKYLASQIDAVSTAMPYRVVGEVVGISGLTIEATELALPVGSLCRITSFGGKTCVAEVIGFQQERTLLMALGAVGGVARGDKIANISAAPSVGCSEELLGRVLDGDLEPFIRGYLMMRRQGVKVDFLGNMLGGGATRTASDVKKTPSTDSIPGE